MTEREKRFEAALREIRDLVIKQQLPITSQVYRLVANALGDTLDDL